jgi:hypothetical protein
MGGLPASEELKIADANGLQLAAAGSSLPVFSRLLRLPPV